MLPKPSRWTCEPYDVAAATRLSAGLGVSPTLATILVRRGVASVEEGRRFLGAGERHDPATLPGGTGAVEAILRHVRGGSRIAVHGDYDVDGVCATAMLVRALRRLGASPSWELPSRFGDGYGLSRSAVERLAGAGSELLITVDCGITAVHEVEAALAGGMEVVVTDHHRPAGRLPDCTVVHPALGEFGCPELCAAGVALKLSEALFRAAGVDPGCAEEDLDLAALATVCDLVPLRGENRRIAREGLAALARTRKPGLRALMRVAGVEPAEVSEQALGFRLGPRLNAAGRMQRADAALELLMTEDAARAEEVARELDLLNRDRQEAETRMLFAADADCAAQASAGALVVAGQGWHPGVVGIVASRLVERWRRPCVVVALGDDGGRGSGRSIPAYDLHAGLAACAAHLRRFGGHRAAAGLELDADAVEPFRGALARHAAGELAPSDLLPVERVDAVVPGGVLGLELAEELELLRPFGLGNPEPTLLVPAARLEGVSTMGEGRHARFTLVTGAARSRGVAFGTSHRALAGAGPVPQDLALRLERNRWNGTVEPRVQLRAACPTRAGAIRVVGPEEPFWVRFERELERDPACAGGRVVDRRDADGRVVDRRGEGFAGVAGDLLTSGERVLIAVANVPRRRASLEALVAGLAAGALAVVSWSALAEAPALAGPFDHLLALDPPPAGPADPLLGAAPTGHMAWGPAEAEFTLSSWRAELELRPALAASWRSLCELGQEAPARGEEPRALEAALAGQGRYPRSPECCGRVVRVLRELRLVEYVGSAAGGPACRPLRDRRAELERSASYRAYRRRLESIDRALAPELALRQDVAAGAR